MSELHVIQAALAGAANRRRWERALRGFWRGLLAGALLWLVALGAYKAFPLPMNILLWAGAAAGVCMLVGLILGGWRQPSLPETARWLDAKQNLKERLSTALEVAQSPASGEWKQLLMHDAATHAQGLDPRRLLPFHLPTAANWALLVLLLGAGLGFVPEYRSKEFIQKQADAENIKDTGKQLAELTKRSIEQRAPVLEPTQKALETVNELGQQMAKVSLTRTDALKDLANVREKLEKEAKELARNPALKPLEKAARESSSSGAKNPEAMQKQIDALQQSLGKGDAANPDKLDQLKNELAKAQKAAANMPDKDSPAGKAAREQLSQALNELAKHAAEMGQPLDNLEDAIKALEKGAIDQVMRDMQATADDLEKLKDMAKALQSLQQQAAQMGKDLAEQLKNGQAQAAQQTLEKMIQKLKEANLNQEQLDKILDEVAKAVNPAGEYGKVAEHLKDAVKLMKECQNPGASSAQQGQSKQLAAQSLADAAKELEKLAQQMADAQQLAETLAALERAQQAIATGKGWGQCNKPGKCGSCDGKGCADCNGRGWKPGGGMNASGVGTWADDETGWIYYPDKVPQTPVDNSGVQRPDMDSKGISDRGPGELNENLSPTKVKGQMTPGSQMPSITLKGVSIKGQSTVSFSEAATAAQTEAQSALNQDQVPRAYRGAVRDYFDDLKK